MDLGFYGGENLYLSEIWNRLALCVDAKISEDNAASKPRI